MIMIFFKKGVLEYSGDGKDWKAIGGERSGHKVDTSDLQIEARYVRYRLTHAGVPGGKPDLWTAVREFKVNDSQHKASIYTNVSKWNDASIKTTEDSVSIQHLSGITLQPNQYIGLELPTLERLRAVTLHADTKGLQLEASENGVEWEKIATDDEAYPDAAYVRIINLTNKDITFDLGKLEVTLNRFAAPKVAHNYESVYEGKADNMFDGDLNSKVWFGGMQDKGKYVQVDLGGVVNVENVAVVIGDGEKDYFRQGNLQVSKDGESWKTIHTFEHPDDLSKNFPDHEVPYRYKRVKTDGIGARYVRLVSTSDNNAWLALNEIIINEGSALPGNEHLIIDAKPLGSKGQEADKAIDNKLATFYQPDTDGSGELSYKLVKNTDLAKLIILQSPAAITGAKVSIRDTTGWHDAGILSESLHAIDMSAYDHVLELKLVWDGKVKPQIHEIIPVKSQGVAVETIKDIKALADELLKGGEIANEQTLHALQIHLTTVQHFEKLQQIEKIVKHMEGFKALLKQQKQQKKHHRQRI
ncbi:discoidin domain-containing protein [Virgibacillus halophilus]|uniref:Discoidin domain-containing protein n=1 Tax=Tigheibacillus halophilus TaxID=361280 RepID=A0ABU5C3L7_9BACI|nr:discoidin domain-containing protein [Virgibacillus halophilus]